MCHVEFVPRAEHEVHSLDSHDFPCPQLRVASYHDYVGAGVPVHDFPYQLPSLFLRYVGDAARVDDEDVRSLFCSRGHRSRLFEAVLDRGGFREIQFAS